MTSRHEIKSYTPRFTRRALQEDVSFSTLVAVCRPFKKVFVVGPQRSGTTLCAFALSNELDYAFVDEHEYGGNEIFDYRSMLRVIPRYSGGVVVQAPAITHQITDFADRFSLVVIMYRDLDAIRMSEKRIGWKRWGEDVELKNYRARFGEYFKPGMFVADLKYKVWETYQRPRVAHFVEFSYEKFRDSPYWVDQERRVNFAPKQVIVGPNGVLRANRSAIRRNASIRFLWTQFTSTSRKLCDRYVVWRVKRWLRKARSR